eukprot:g7359.t1
MADPAAVRALLAGESPVQGGPVWLLCLYRFKNSAGRDACQLRFDALPVGLVGGKRVLRLFDNVCTVCNGGGAVPMWDAVSIESYPTPAALGAVLASQPFPIESALVDLELHCLQGQWGAGSDLGAAPAPLPAGALEDAKRLADIKHRDKAKLAAIMGDPEPFVRYVQDDRFQEGRVWQLNLLKVEDNPYYAMYGARAANVITKGGTGGEGGLMLSSRSKVWTIRGAVAYDFFAVMQYPSRDAFVNFAMSQAGSEVPEARSTDNSIAKSDKGALAGGKERHALRTAGLAVQSLVSLAPDGLGGVFQDPDVPSRISKL